MSEKKETASLEGGLTWGTTFDPYRAEARVAQPIPTDFFGDAIEPVKHSSRLSTEFVYPPFSVLNARDGWWQERKREWLALGIQSELGRGENTLNLSGESNQEHRYNKREYLARLDTADPAATAARKRANATPGGSLKPSMDSYRRDDGARGDGRGRPVK